MNFKYSVLMSVYCDEKPEYLKKSIESMLNQTMQCDEFVLVKDGKLTEDLDNIINEYKNKYFDLFKIIELEKNCGLGIALKEGIKNCKNEWIARIDSDDLSTSNRCEKQIKMIKNNSKLDLIGAYHAEFTDSIENIKSIKKLPINNDEIIRYAKRRNPFSHSVMMMRKSKVLEAGNYRKYYYVEDYDLWIRMIQKGAISYNIPEVLSYVRVSEDLYRRRGGIKYLKSILKFKKEQLNNGFYSLKDYIISTGSHIVVCLLPGFLRKFIYTKLLRKIGKEKENDSITCS